MTVILLDHFVKELVEWSSSAQILINNAGTLTYAPVLEVTTDECEHMFAINVVAAYDGAAIQMNVAYDFEDPKDTYVRFNVGKFDATIDPTTKPCKFGDVGCRVGDVNAESPLPPPSAFRANERACPTWSACSWVMKTASMSSNWRSAACKRLLSSRRLKPQSISKRDTWVPHWASTRVALPALPLPRFLKRSTGLLKFADEQLGDFLGVW